MGSLRVWKCPLLFQIIDGFADALHNIDKGIVMRGPAGDGLAIFRENLEFGEGRSLPVGGTQDDGQDTCLVGIMPCDRLRHLDTVTEIGGDEDGKRHVNLLWWCSMLLEALYPETQQLSLRIWWND